MGILSYVDWCAANQINTHQTLRTLKFFTCARLWIEEWLKNSQKIGGSICHWNRNFDEVFRIVPVMLLKLWD